MSSNPTQGNTHVKSLLPLTQPAWHSIGKCRLASPPGSDEMACAKQHSPTLSLSPVLHPPSSRLRAPRSAAARLALHARTQLARLHPVPAREALQSKSPSRLLVLVLATLYTKIFQPTLPRRPVCLLSRTPSLVPSARTSSATLPSRSESRYCSR